jgi:hypothetical protein
MVQALQVAGQFEGGLNRTNLILAIRALDMTPPLLRPGITWNMDGNKDAYFTEGSDISKYDSAAQSWVPQGEVINLAGKSGLCPFDQAAGVCRQS